MLRPMARYVVDAHALLHIASAGVSVHPDHHLVAPNAVRSESLSLLYEQVRLGDVSEADALRLHERLTEVKIRLLGDRVFDGHPGGSLESTAGTTSAAPSTSP